MQEDDKSCQSWYTTGTGGPPPEGHTPSRSAETDVSSLDTRPADPSPSCPDAFWTEKDLPKPRQRPAWVRPAGICLLILVLIIATAFIFTDGGKDVNIHIGDWEYHSEPKQDEPENYEDFRDFFENYYTASADGGNSIPRAETGTGVTLPLTAQQGEELTLQEIYSRCAPSVVAITASMDAGGYIWGSGIIFTSDGYVVTNAHILDGASSVSVTLWDDSSYEAKLVGLDSVSDLAVLKMDARGLTPAEFVDSSNLSVGDEVIAIGSPLGETFRGTMTNGIISAIDRSVSYNGHSMTLMQTNAAINEGNSGGPLINLAGQVIGITNMKMMSYYSSIEGIGFAIPSSTIKAVADSLIANGAVTGRPVIGITLGAVPDGAADYYGLPSGLYVTEVTKGSDAEAKGVQQGDIVTHVNGKAVATTYDVSLIKDSLKVGDTILLTIYRSGSTFDVEVTLVEAEALK